MLAATRFSLAVLVAALSGALLSCGGGYTSGSAGGGGDTTTSTAGAGGATGGAGGTTATGGATGGAGGDMGTIPDPGTTVGGEWTDVEPNDTPSQAVPVGILNGSVWMGFADPVTAISSPTDVDYFVFKTGDAASLANDNIQVCWSFAGNLLDLNLYAVDNGKKGALLKSATDTAGACETLIAPGEGTALLTVDTVYLLEVVAGPGLDLMGDPGLYSA